MEPSQPSNAEAAARGLSGPHAAGLATPLCADLRSKKYYFLDRPARTAADLLDASNDCWCARTGMRMGPDDQVVDASDCVSGRACYRRAGAERPEA